MTLALHRAPGGARAALAWRGLQTAAAFHHDGRWSLLGSPEEALEPGSAPRLIEAQARPRVASTAERRTRLIDLGTALGLAVVLALGVRARRRRRTA